MSCVNPSAAGGEPRPPHPLELSVTWRRFQEIALAQLIGAAMAGDQRLQLVAPPGAGKTLMGLYLGIQLGRPVLVLANTRAIAAQWRQTFLRFALDYSASFDDLEHLVSLELPRPEDRMRLLTVSTYQAFTRQRPAKLRRGAETVSERLAPSVTAVQDRFGKAGPLVILDECHHLRAWWADVLADLLERWPDTTVLGLTATPPHDAPADERRRFARLVTDVTHEIPLVGAVREGLLAPFQDLAVFVRPGEDDARLLAGCEAELTAWLAEARDSVGEGDAWVPGLLHHVEQRCLQPGRRQTEYTDFLELIDRDPDFAIALVRYLERCDVDWPAEVYPLPEMAFPLTRRDLLALLDDYLLTTLAPLPAAAERVASLKRALAPLGVQVRKDGLRGQGAAVEDAFARSRARFSAAVRILEREWQLLGTDLCAAVVCDFARSAAGGERVEEGFVPGAVGAFRAIAAAPGLADMLPMLATGEARWIPAALEGDLRERLGPLSVGLSVSPVPAEEAGTTAGTWLAVGLPGHEGRLLRAMTGLLEREHSHCVVGTRALLGEGWDCRSLDTLVDLTAARSHVSVNQLRGRTLRVDPDTPEKVAHIWDVVVVPPLASGATFGLADLERFAAKHERFHAPADDATLERGAGHVHPALRGEPRGWLDALPAVEAELWAAAESRGEARARWRLGTPLDEREEVLVRAAPPPPGPTGRGRGALPQPGALVGEGTERFEAAWSAREQAIARRWPLVAAGGVATLVGLGLAMTDAVAGAGLAVGLGGALVGVLCVGAALLGLRRATDAVSAATPALDEAERTRRLLRVLLRALPKASKKTREVDVALDVAADGAVQLRLEGGDERARQRVAEAADQTLRGCPAPHYAIEVFSPAAPSGGWRSDAGEAAFTSAGFLPVPSALGTSRRVAEAWAEAWRAELGPCELVAVRKQRATDALPWRDPASLRWLRASARRGDTRRALR